jgi:hypothetical protein
MKPLVVGQVRPQLAAAASFQRTSYLPGEIGQVDWWHAGIQVDVAPGSLREVLALVVVTLPASVAHAAVLLLRTTATA